MGLKGVLSFQNTVSSEDYKYKKKREAILRKKQISGYLKVTFIIIILRICN